MKFQVGDKVRINEKCTKSYFAGRVGTIDSILGNGCIRVSWPSNELYRRSALLVYNYKELLAEKDPNELLKEIL